MLAGSPAERDVKRIVEAAVWGEPVSVAVEFLAADGLVAGVIRIETIIPRQALIRISTSGFVLKNRTSVNVLLGKPLAFKRTLARCESLRLLVLSMGLLCRGSMVTFERKQLETTS